MMLDPRLVDETVLLDSYKRLIHSRKRIDETRKTVAHSKTRAQLSVYSHLFGAKGVPDILKALSE